MNIAGFEDPCLTGPAAVSYLTSYCKIVMEGQNLNHKSAIRASTVAEYMSEVNVLYKKRKLPVPIDFRSREDGCAILIENQRKQEGIAMQRDPLSAQMVALIMATGLNAPHDSLESLMRDIIITGREIGFRSCEISQTTMSKPNYHEYPNGTRVIKSICEDWLTSLDRHGNEISDPVADGDALRDMILTWYIQKNRRNREKRRYRKNEINSEFCVPSAFRSMIARARSLDQPSHLPLTVYRDAKGKKKYLSHKVLTDYLRKIAKLAHPNITPEALQRISAHSIRVWACVLLFEAGKKGDYIKKRLRWLSDCYRVYLRDTQGLAEQHNECLDEYAALIKSLMALSVADLPQHAEDTVPIDQNMGEYADFDE